MRGGGGGRTRNVTADKTTETGLSRSNLKLNNDDKDDSSIEFNQRSDEEIDATEEELEDTYQLFLKNIKSDHHQLNQDH